MKDFILVSRKSEEPESIEALITLENPNSAILMLAKLVGRIHINIPVGYSGETILNEAFVRNERDKTTVLNGKLDMINGNVLVKIERMAYSVDIAVMNQNGIILVNAHIENSAFMERPR